MNIDQAAFSASEVANHFADFAAWLGRTRGARKASLTIHRYLPFFLEIEDEWGDIPNYDRLLEHFGAGGLRRSLLPVRWMTETGLIVPNAEARLANSDRRRVDALMQKFPADSSAGDALQGYYLNLARRVEAGDLKLRSMRLALTAAAGLLAFTNENGENLPDQRALEAYLKHSPGQRDAVSGFVGHLREEEGAPLSLPKRNALSARSRRRRHLKQKLLAMMREDADSDEMDIEWIRTALAYFHDLPTKVANSVSGANVVPDRKGLTITIHQKRYWIPPRSNSV